MVSRYTYINATEEERRLVDSVLDYIELYFSDKIDVKQLKFIEIVDELPAEASGRSMEGKIILSRKNRLNGIVQYHAFDIATITDKRFWVGVSTIYHELWHVSTWNKYKSMYDYVLDEESEDNFLAYAYMYWIEYLAHKETVCMEDEEESKNFCIQFANRHWNEDEYGYFIKALPYYLIRANYWKCFISLTSKMRCDKLRHTVVDFDIVSRKLLRNDNITDMEKAAVLRELIEEFITS